MDLTICVPCFNDAKNVDKLLLSIYSSDTESLIYEILVCDGKSDDGIEEIVLSWESKIPVRLISTSYRASASENINELPPKNKTPDGKRNNAKQGAAAITGGASERTRIARGFKAGLSRFKAGL